MCPVKLFSTNYALPRIGLKRKGPGSSNRVEVWKSHMADLSIAPLEINMVMVVQKWDAMPG